MPKKAASSAAKGRTTRATTKRKREDEEKEEKPQPIEVDEDDDWSCSPSNFTSAPTKVLTYSLDALLAEKATAPSPPPPKEEESDDEEINMSILETGKDIGLSALSSEGYKKTEEIRQMLHFDDELQKTEEYMNLIVNPYTPKSTVPTFAIPDPNHKPVVITNSKKTSNSQTGPAHESALESMRTLLDPNRGSDESEEALAIESKASADIAADGVTLLALLRPFNNYLLKADTIQGDGLCRGFSPWLLSLIAYHPQRVIAGSIFNLYAQLLGSTSHNDVLGALPGFVTRTLTHTPANIYWANLLSPDSFYAIWRAYGIVFVGQCAETSNGEKDTNTTTTNTIKQETTTTATTTTTDTAPTTSDSPKKANTPKSSPSTSPKKSSPDKTKTVAKSKSNPKLAFTQPKAPAKGRATRADSRKKAKVEVEETTDSVEDEEVVPAPKPVTFPHFNFSLILQLLQLCTETSLQSFSTTSIRTLINQVFQFMLDKKTYDTPSINPVFESLLHSLLQLPPSHKRSHTYTTEQQQMLHDLCDDFKQASTSHRLWVRATQAIPVTTTPALHLRGLLACKFLHTLASSHLSPAPLSLTLPSPFSPTYHADLLRFMTAVVTGEYAEDSVLLSVVQLVGLGLGPELGLFSSSSPEVAELKRALQSLNLRVKEAGLFTLVKTKSKDLLVMLAGMLSLSGNKKETSL